MSNNNPTPIVNIIKGAASIVKTNVLRKDISPKELVQYRSDICRGCIHAKLYGNGDLRTCGKFMEMLTKTKTNPDGTTTVSKPCGCILKQKIKDSKQHCPLGKW